MNLAPLAIQKFFDNNGNPMNGGLLFTYVAGTTTKIATYTDSTGGASNTNPIILDFRGEARVWLDPTLVYKFTLAPPGDTDPPTRPIWTVDNITSAISFADLTQQIIGQILYPRTAAEIAAGVTPTFYYYPPYWVPRYGSNPSPGSTDCTAAVQNAIKAAEIADTVAYLPGFFGEARITTVLSITSGRSGLVGDGMGKSRLLCDGVSGISIAAGLSFVDIRGLTLATSVRYTTTPNTLTGILSNGTTGSEVLYALIQDVFFDGFETCIKMNAMRDGEITGCIAAQFGKSGIIGSGLITSMRIHDNDFSGGAIAGSVGIRIGDGTAATEGNLVHDNVLYGFAVGIDLLATSFNSVHDNLIDQPTQFGILHRSSATIGCGGNEIHDNQIFMIGAADTGIYLTNSIVLSAGADRGTSVRGNQVNKYAGSTITNGILVDGTQDNNHTFLANRCNGNTFDCRITAGTGHIVANNKWLGAGFSSSVTVNYGSGNTGTNLTVNTSSGYTLDGSATYDPPNLADGAGATTTVTVTGAELGDLASYSFSLDIQGITVTAYVSAANTVTVRFQNESGGALDIGSGTLRARVLKR